MPRVNYLIAACSYRTCKDDGSGIQGKDVLRLHLEQLAKTNTKDIDQVTIIRALPLDRCPGSMEYWNLGNLPKKLGCPCMYLDVPDMYFSYSSWIQAIMSFKDTFDYSILIEDDYYPSNEDFVKILIRLHQEKLPKGGYLNGYTVGEPFRIAAVSNGICDTETFLKGIKKHPTPECLSQGAQQYFGYEYFDNQLADWTDQYRTLFWNGHLVNETHDPSLILTEDIINPIQYLALEN